MQRHRDRLQNTFFHQWICSAELRSSWTCCMSTASIKEALWRDWFFIPLLRRDLFSPTVLTWYFSLHKRLIWRVYLCVLRHKTVIYAPILRSDCSLSCSARAFAEPRPLQKSANISYLSTRHTGALHAVLQQFKHREKRILREELFSWRH